MTIIAVDEGQVLLTPKSVGLQRLYSESVSDAVTNTGAVTQNAYLYSTPADTVTNTLALVDALIYDKTASDTVNLAEIWSGVSIVVATVTSSVTMSETISPQGILLNSVADSVVFRFTLPDSDDLYEGWVVNANTFAPSRYENFGFNSFAKIGNVYLGAKSDGVFELDGETDDGTDISAAVMTGKMDFGSMQLKSMYNAVLGIAADGDMYLRVVHEDNPSFTYRINIRDDAMRNARVDIGRGMALRYWQVEVYNANGADFNLESMKLYPVVLNRRITER